MNKVFWVMPWIINIENGHCYLCGEFLTDEYLEKIGSCNVKLDVMSDGRVDFDTENVMEYWMTVVDSVNKKNKTFRSDWFVSPHFRNNRQDYIEIFPTSDDLLTWVKTITRKEIQ